MGSEGCVGKALDPRRWIDVSLNFSIFVTKY